MFMAITVAYNEIYTVIWLQTCL